MARGDAGVPLCIHVEVGDRWDRFTCTKEHVVSGMHVASGMLAEGFCGGVTVGITVALIDVMIKATWGISPKRGQR